MAGVRLSLLWSVDGYDEKIYPVWGRGRTRKPPKIKEEIPQPKIVEVEPIEITILKHRIKAKKESLEATQVYACKLYSHNVALMDKILRMEEKTQFNTDKILGRYEHYKGAIAKLKIKSSESITEAQDDLDGVRAATDREATALRGKARKLSSQIEQCSRQLQVMRHYKDNEFPVRMAKIEQMKNKLVDEGVEQEERILYLQKNIVEKSLADIELQAKRDESLTVEAATKGYLETTKKSVEAKAIQNELMLKEISMHQKERKTLEADIEKLKRSITHIKSSLKRRVFTKCQPDTNITLDIPVFEPLPV